MKEQKYIVKGKLKNSDKVMRNAFWVGIYPELSKIQLKKIAKTIYQFINQKEKIMKNKYELSICIQVMENLKNLGIALTQL